MSLANKIHNTEINHEIDQYLESINAMFEDTTKDELIKKFFSVEFTRFYNYYKKSRDLSVEAGSSRDSDRRSNPDSVRFFINVGKKDGYNWQSLKDFLRDTLSLGQDDLFKVDVMDSFSFFNTDKAHLAKVAEVFTDFKVDGRFVNVEVSEDKGRGRDRGRGRGRGRKTERRSGGGDRRSGGGERRSRRSEGSRSESRDGNRSRRSEGRSDSNSGRRSEGNSNSGSGRPRRSRRR